MSNSILVLNAGSSSIKFAAYTEDLGEICAGTADLLTREISWRIVGREKITQTLDTPTHACAMQAVRCIVLTNGWRVIAVGYRVVQGGTKPEVIDHNVIKRLTAVPQAFELHQPPALNTIASAHRAWPNALHVACYDTLHGSNMSEIATTFAIPRHWRDTLRAKRYMYHGLSYEGVAHELEHNPQVRAIVGDPTVARVVVLHLGNGCSASAMFGGKCVLGTLEYGVTCGFPMSTRCGPLDPTVALAIAREVGVDEAERILLKESGHRALSGISDMREIITRALAGDKPAVFDLEHFVHTITLQIGTLMGVVNTEASKVVGMTDRPLLDALIWRGGIGERSAEIRERVLGRLGWMGFLLDHAANQAGEMLITSQKSVIPSLVMPADEQIVIARHVKNMLGAHSILAAE